MPITVISFPITFVNSEYLNIFKAFVENNIILDTDDVSLLDEYRIEYRFAAFTTQDDQNATNLLPNSELEYYPDENNRANIDISIISDLFIPAFPTAQGLYNTQFKVFQVQYREKYLESTGEVIGNWVSVHDSSLGEFVPFIVIHAGGDQSQFTDILQIFNNSKNLYRNYQNDILLISSEANRSTKIGLTLKYFTRAKGVYQEASLIISAFNGVYVIRPIQDLINNSNVRYLGIYLGSTLLSSHVIYNTSQSQNEFVLRWLGSEGDVKSWTFTKKAKLESQIETNLNVRDFRAIPRSIEETFMLETDGLNKTEHDFVKDINTSNLITLTTNQNTFNCILSNPSWIEDTYNNTYTFSIDVIKKEQYLMKV